jgi:hypothetical protein
LSLPRPSHIIAAAAAAAAAAASPAGLLMLCASACRLDSVVRAALHAHQVQHIQSDAMAHDTVSA